MAKADIHKDGEYMPTEVGHSIYVWSRGGAKPSGKRGCVITSHGLDMESTEIIKAAHPVPQVELYFYAPHGFGLPDNSAEGVMTRKTKWYERVQPGMAKHDYWLTKAQGSHSAVGDHETYGHIQKGFHPTGRRERAKAGYMIEMESAMKMKTPETRIGMARAAQDAYKNQLAILMDVQLDVVTIRNRRGIFHGQVTLFSAIQLLEKHGFKYSEVHCNFCRGPKEGHNMSSNASP
jgi:hypothetical protein